MKIKKRGTGALAVLLALMIGLTPMTAFAKVESEFTCICEEKCEKENVNPNCKVCQIDISLCEGKEKEKEEKFGPLTPDGNLTLVDDFGSMEAGGKQFITVVTKSGNYFYIIIDRDDEGDETVHFLNMVDEADLLRLMDEEEVETYMKSMTEKEELPSPTPQPTVAPVEEAPKEEENAAPIGSIVLLLLLAGGGAAGYVYYTGKKKQDVIPTYEDPDADYKEEEDYLAGILDDDMDMEEDDEDITEELFEEVE